MSKYEDSIFINQYVGLWAYGYYNGFTGTESIYRIVKSFIIEEYNKSDNLNVLDIGCGVGRSTKDMAEYLENATITAVDLSELSIKMAKKILLNKEKKDLEVNLDAVGFGKFKIPTFNFEKIRIINSSFDNFCHDKEYDLIVAINFLDRCDNLELAIDKIYKSLKPGGIFIGSTPLNFSRKEQWLNMNCNNYLKDQLLQCGFKINNYLNNVPYREVLDARGAYNEFYVDIFDVKK